MWLYKVLNQHIILNFRNRPLGVGVTLHITMDFGGIGGIFEELAFGMASFATLTTAAIYSKHKSTAHNIEVSLIIFLKISFELPAAH